MKSYLIFVFFLGSLALFDDKKEKGFDRHMFDSNSKFMKGFETGILVRSKKGDPAAFGCKPEEPHERNQIIGKMIDSVLSAIETAKSV